YTSICAKHGMIGPNSEIVLHIFLQRFIIMNHHLLTIFRSNFKLRSQLRVEGQLASLQFVRVDVGIWSRMISFRIHKEDGMEYLLRCVRVHRGDNVGQLAKVAIDKLTQADIILNRALSTATADEEFRARDAEGILDVDQQKGDALCRSRGRLEVVLKRELAGVFGADGIIHPPNFAYMSF